MKVVYEIRTVRGTPVFRADALHRAEQEMQHARKRIGTNLYLFKIVQTEEEVLYTGVKQVYPQTLSTEQSDAHN